MLQESCDVRLAARSIIEQTADHVQESFIHTVLTTPYAEGGWMVVSPPMDESIFDDRPAECVSVFNISRTSADGLVSLDCKATQDPPAWLGMTVTTSVLKSIKSEPAVATFSVSRRPRFLGAIDQMVPHVSRVCCTVLGVSTPQPELELARVIVVPPKFAVPMDVAVHTMSGAVSAVQVSADGSVGLDLTTSGNQNITFLWAGQTTAFPVGVIIVTEDSLRVKQFMSYSSRITLPRISALWPSACSTGDTGGGTTRRRASIIFHQASQPISTQDLTLLEELYRAGPHASLVSNDPRLAALGVESADIACPPFCPGTRASDWYNSAAGMGKTAIRWSVRYVCECQGYPTGPLCLDPATAGRCAWGEGDDCQPCPAGALCPGGYQSLPLPGFWNRDGESSEVVECDAPYPERCLGWSAGRKQPSCAPGHDPATSTCRGCLVGYYPMGPNLCTKCPAVDGFGDRMMPVLKVLAGVVLVAVALLAAPMAYIIYQVRAHLRSKTDHQAATVAHMWSHLVEFLVYLLQLIALLVQAARYLPSALPSWLRTPLAELQMLLLDVKAVHPACTGSPPMQQQTVILSISLVLITCLVVVVWLRQKLPTRRRSTATRLGRVIHNTLVVLYPVVVVTLLESLDCRTVGGEGSRWWSNIYVACYGPDHIEAAVLGFLALTVHTIGMPVVTFYLVLKYVRRRRLETGIRSDRGKAASIWSYYTDTSMQPGRFYYFHVMFLSTVLVATDTQFLRDRAGTPWLMWCGWVVVVVVVVCGRLLFIFLRPPYGRQHKWMVWPEASVLISLAVLRSTLLVLYISDTQWMAVLTVIAVTMTAVVLVCSFLYGIRRNTSKTIASRIKLIRKPWEQPSEARHGVSGGTAWMHNPMAPSAHTSLGHHPLRRQPSRPSRSTEANRPTMCEPTPANESRKLEPARSAKLSLTLQSESQPAITHRHRDSLAGPILARSLGSQTFTIDL